MNINTDHLNRCIGTLRVAWEGLQQGEAGDVLCEIYRAACVKKPYRDARGRVRAGKIHHYEFAEVVNRALEYAGKAFNEAREAERNGRLPEKELTDFAEDGAGEEDCPMVHNSGSEKSEVEVASKSGKRDSRSAAADAAVERLSTDAVGSGNGGAAPAQMGEPVAEGKRCACGGEIPPEKAGTRDECRDCYTARVRLEEEERRAAEDEQRRLGFLEGRDRGRPQRGLFSRGEATGPLPAGG